MFGYGRAMRHDGLTERIIGAAIEVHRELGPGLLESAYGRCLQHELALRGIAFRAEAPFALVYKELHLDYGYRADLLVEDRVIVEVKAVEALTPVHDAQVLTYLRLSGRDTGLLINFNVLRLRHGLKRLVLNRNDDPDPYP